MLIFDQALIMDTYIDGIMDQLKVLVDKVAATSTNVAGSNAQLKRRFRGGRQGHAEHLGHR